jgi:hypothetical protein
VRGGARLDGFDGQLQRLFELVLMTFTRLLGL